MTPVRAHQDQIKLDPPALRLLEVPWLSSKRKSTQIKNEFFCKGSQHPLVTPVGAYQDQTKLDPHAFRLLEVHGWSNKKKVVPGN